MEGAKVVETNQTKIERRWQRLRPTSFNKKAGANSNFFNRAFNSVAGNFAGVKRHTPPEF
jgi:hypothetical protein